MKIINGEKYYLKHEVAALVGRSTQTIHLWSIWSNELEAGGKERLIPAPIRGKSNYRLWSKEDVKKIVEFRNNLTKGDLKHFTDRLNRRKTD